MDELKLNFKTNFMKNMITKIIAKAVKKKFGCDLDTQINELQIETIDGKVRIHANIDAEVKNEDVMKVIGSFI